MSDDLSIPSPTYRVPRRSRGMDPATKRLAIIAGAFAGVLVLVVGGWSVLGHRSGTVPVVQADSRPIRVKPENPGGMQIAGAADGILSGDSGNDDTGKLAPPPEAPAPQALRAPPPPRPVAAASAPVPLPALAPAVPKPAAPTAEHRTAAVAAPAPAHAAAPATGGPLVQLAAVSSEDAAKSEWQRLGKRLPDLLAHRHPDISKIDRDGRTFWRVRTGGFSDAAQATVFCERVRAKGAGCTVADF